MNELKVFSNEKFGEIRIIIEDGKTYFSAFDVASQLGYSNPRKAVGDHCRCVTKRDVPHPQSSTKKLEMNFISEADLYRLIVGSMLPSAVEFEAWIFEEVLPSIRVNGGYMVNQENLTPEQIVANALVVAQNIITHKDKIIEEQKPKVEFFDAVADSKSAIAIGDVAKMLGIKGIGRNNLFELLRDKKVLMQNNQPYQKYIDNGYFRVIEQKFTKPNGETVVTFKTLVYQKGVAYIRKLLV